MREQIRRGLEQLHTRVRQDLHAPFTEDELACEIPVVRRNEDTGEIRFEGRNVNQLTLDDQDALLDEFNEISKTYWCEHIWTRDENKEEK